MKCFICETGDATCADHSDNKVIYVLCEKCGRGPDEDVQARIRLKRRGSSGL